MNWLMMSFYDAAMMLWQTFWALTLGFSISAALQVFVSKEQITRAFGRDGFKPVALAMGLGAASSSCSYAAAATGRSALKKGAAFVPMLAFMIASTNLVIELGAVLWLLMGWRFVLAEIVGSFVLVGFMWLFVKLLLPKNVESEARQHAGADAEEACCHHDHGYDEPTGKLTALAQSFVADWAMLWKEILAGFLIAGFLMALVPNDWWQKFFLTDVAEPWRLIENAAVGPLIAVASFVCSIGNIPLASLLWSNGISFGGVASFIYGDLIVVPLILVYAKYYGARAAAWLTIMFYFAMVFSGIVVDLLFAALGLVPKGPRPQNAVEHANFQWNYTTWLDAIAVVIFAAFLFLQLRGDKSRRSRKNF